MEGSLRAPTAERIETLRTASPRSSSFIRRVRIYTATPGGDLCPQPFPMAQSSETNRRCGFQSPRARLAVEAAADLTKKL